MIREAEKTVLRRVAEDMVLAARTAPKAKGIDNLELVILEREDIVRLADEMERLGNVHASAAFTRDAGNLREHVHVAVLLGTRVEPINLKFCGLCGLGNCAGNREKQGRCVFGPHDLGIAVGAAASVAAQQHADNRVMYTIGMAALSRKLFATDVKIALGLPLSASGKNPFFDR
jgi:uncharacterized ferredoxin-like protein